MENMAEGGQKGGGASGRRKTEQKGSAARLVNVAAEKDGLETQRDR